MFNRDFLIGMPAQLVMLWPDLSSQDRQVWSVLVLAVVAKIVCEDNGQLRSEMLRFSTPRVAASNVLQQAIIDPIREYCEREGMNKWLRRFEEAQQELHSILLSKALDAVKVLDVQKIQSEQLKFLIKVFRDRQESLKFEFEAACRNYRKYLATLAEGSEFKKAKQEVFDDVNETFQGAPEKDIEQQCIKIDLLTQVLTEVGKSEFDGKKYTQLKDNVASHHWGKKLADTMSKHTSLFVFAGLLAAGGIVLIGCMPVIGLPLALGIGISCLLGTGVLTRLGVTFFNKYKNTSLEKVADLDLKDISPPAA